MPAEEDATTGAPEQGYVRRLDPDWILLMSEHKSMLEEVGELKKSNHRQEKYLVGGWSADGQYTPGLRDEIGSLKKLTAWIVAGIWALATISCGAIAAAAANYFLHPPIGK